MIRLSVIIPVFGVERFISRCLDSVFSINLPQDEYEVLCIDDCSQDSSVKIIERYQSTHPNLMLLRHSENKRQGGARNTGIRFAKGKYIIFVDADDCIPPYDLVGLLDYMEDNGMELVLGAADIISENGETTRWGNAPHDESPIMTGPSLFTDGYIHKIAYGVVWLGVYLSELARRTRPFVENVPYEDTDWTLQCAYFARRVQFKPVVLYNYIQNPVSTTRHPSMNTVINRVKQGLRIWAWGQTVTENREAVILAVKDYCVYNLQILLSLWKYRNNERTELYDSFSRDEWETMKTWFDSEKSLLSLGLHHPALSRITLNLISPFLRMGKHFKFLLN
jgi:glycosyltransferase involved in cell wall biosynthesis